MENSVDLRLWLLTHLDESAYLATIHKAVLVLTFAGFVGCSFLVWRSRTTSASKWMHFLASDFVFAFFLTAFIIAGRWPGLLAPEENVDESYFLACAQKLQHDLVYWRSVEAGTSGPLNVYPLILPALFGFKPEYASARGFALLLVVISCLCLHFSLKHLYGTRTARLAVMPVVTTFALMTADDYVHFSSEHVPIAITSIALYLVCRLAVSGESAGTCLVFLCGLVLGTAPYAKLQAAPLTAAIGCICLSIIWSRRTALRQALQRAFVFGCGAASFSIVHLAFVVVYSLQEIFLRSYIIENVRYSKFNASIVEKALNFIHVAGDTPETRVLFGLTAATLVVGVPVLVLCRPRLKVTTIDAEGKNPPHRNDTFIFLLYSLALLAAAAYAVAQPQRRFYHYALFLIVPSGFAMGVVLGELRRIGQKGPATARFASILVPLICTGCVAACALQLGTSLIRENRFIGRRHRFLENYVTPVAKAILEHASPADSMAIWGWSPKLHVETGVRQATRSSIPLGAFQPSPQQAFYVKQYAAELRDSNARLFVDTQIPGNLSYEWLGVPGQRFEEMPEIAQIVARDFAIVRRVDGVTIYARK